MNTILLMLVIPLAWLLKSTVGETIIESYKGSRFELKIKSFFK